MPSVVIVGAGVFGSSLARELAIAGWDVTLVEQHEPGHDGSSSGGETRLIRWSHGAEEWYTRSARRARDLWRAIDPSIFSEHGLVWFAHSADGWEAASLRTLQAQGIPAERLDPAEAERLFPSLHTADLEWALLEPDAGVLRAAEGVRVLAAQAQAAGARLVRGRAEPAGARVMLDGRAIEGDRVVWACGPWLAALFPALVELRPTLQQVVFVEAGPEWNGVPGWVDYDAAFYGHGNVDGHGFKAAPDAEGPSSDPDAPCEPPNCAPLAHDYVALRFPSLAGAPVHHTRTCPYELTPDTHFIAAPHPEHPSVWLLGGGSGHGFKHGPALAERMREWLSGAADPDPRFGLGPRSVDRNLRTAGARATAIGRRLPEAAS